MSTPAAAAARQPAPGAHGHALAARPAALETGSRVFFRVLLPSDAGRPTRAAGAGIRIDCHELGEIVR
jgi:hypothetical protein